MRERTRKRRTRRSASGGSSLFDLLVPAGLFAASDFMKKRSNKHVRSRSYLTQNSNRKSRRRSY
jgi:hypothetical protein